MDPQSPVPLHRLTTVQRTIVTTINDYQRVTNEPCPASYIARRLGRHHSTIHEHLMALYRHGWLRTPNAPATITRPF